MKSKILYAVVALAVMFGACNKEVADSFGDSDFLGVKASAVANVLSEPYDRAVYDAINPKNEFKDKSVVAQGVKYTNGGCYLTFDANAAIGTYTVAGIENNSAKGKAFKWTVQYDGQIGNYVLTGGQQMAKFKFVEFTPGASTATGSISGTIPEWLGDNVTVYLYGKNDVSLVKSSILNDYPYQIAETVTNEWGEYEFNGVPEGEYVVMVPTLNMNFVSEPLTLSYSGQFLIVYDSDYKPNTEKIYVYNLRLVRQLITTPEHFYSFKFVVDIANYDEEIVWETDHNDGNWYTHTGGFEPNYSSGGGKGSREDGWILFYGQTPTPIPLNRCGDETIRIRAFKNNVKVMDEVSFVYNYCNL